MPPGLGSFMGKEMVLQFAKPKGDQAFFLPRFSTIFCFGKSVFAHFAGESPRSSTLKVEDVISI